MGHPKDDVAGTTTQVRHAAAFRQVGKSAGEAFDEQGVRFGEIGSGVGGGLRLAVH